MLHGNKNEHLFIKPETRNQKAKSTTTTPKNNMFHKNICEKNIGKKEKEEETCKRYIFYFNMDPLFYGVLLLLLLYSMVQSIFHISHIFHLICTELIKYNHLSTDLKLLCFMFHN